VFDGPGPNLIGNAQEPQIIDRAARALGFGLIFAAGGLSTNTAQGAEYHFGTHQAAIYDSQFKGVIFHPPHPNVLGDAVKSISGAPQQVDLTLQAQIFTALTVNQSQGIGAEYQFGLHQTQLANSQIQSQVFPSARTPPAVNKQTLHTLIVNGQELTKDLTIQGWAGIPSVPQGWISTNISAGPQLVDLTVPSQIQKTLILLIQAPYTPTTLFGIPQSDPTQLAAKLFAPPTAKVPYTAPTTLFAAPTPWDPTQNQGSIIHSFPPPPAKYVQPAIVLVREQQYDNLYPLTIVQPYIYVAPPPFTGFWVVAVSAGWYQGVFRTPGDVFLLAQAADFSDSTIDYQAGSNGVGYGWMAKTNLTTPFNWLETNNAPYLPPQDPFRRFVY